MFDSVRPRRQQPTRLARPWDSPGKNTGVGCHFLLQCMKVKSESEVTQSCLTLSDLMDCSLPGSSVHGIFQARVLEWGTIAFYDIPYSSVDKESACTAGDPSSIPGSGRSTGKGIGYPLQYSPSSLVTQADKESTCNMGDLGFISGLGISPGEGNSYPLQYSGLENSMDCIVHGVAKSQTPLSKFHRQITITFYYYYLSIQKTKCHQWC